MKIITILISTLLYAYNTTITKDTQSTTTYKKPLFMVHPSAAGGIVLKH
jgi:hypothetical protein